MGIAVWPCPLCPNMEAEAWADVPAGLNAKLEEAVCEAGSAGFVGTLSAAKPLDGVAEAKPPEGAVEAKPLDGAAVEDLVPAASVLAVLPPNIEVPAVAAVVVTAKLGVNEKPALLPDLLVEPGRVPVPNPAVNNDLFSDWSDFVVVAGAPGVNENPAAAPD